MNAPSKGEGVGGVLVTCLLMCVRETPNYATVMSRVCVHACLLGSILTGSDSAGSAVAAEDKGRVGARCPRASPGRRPPPQRGPVPGASNEARTASQSAQLSRCASRGYPTG